MPGVGLYEKILDEVNDGVYLVNLDRRITYWNRGAEIITGYRASEVVGRRCRENILVHVDERGMNLCEAETCPAQRAMNEGRACEAEVYLHHKDGHRVPVVTRISPIEGPDGHVTGAFEVFNDIHSRAEALQTIEKLERLALLDPLTGLGNRRHAEVHINANLDGLRRYRWPFGLLFLDIDRFKRVNDSYGHDAGDKVLSLVARTAAGAVRSSDTVSRWGGEEFTGNIGNVEEKELAVAAEKIRRLVEQSFVSVEGDTLRVTVSVGATMAGPDDTVQSLVNRADRLMYRSKEEGRNRVTTG